MSNLSSLPTLRLCVLSVDFKAPPTNFITLMLRMFCVGILMAPGIGVGHQPLENDGGKGS
jgi:hypothetical protein